MTDREPPLLAGGQDRVANEILFGARVVAICAAGVLLVALVRAMGGM